MKKNKDKYSWWELILYIIRFIFNRNKLNENEVAQQQQETNEHLQEEYDKIDQEIEENKDDDLEDRINNNF